MRRFNKLLAIGLVAITLSAGCGNDTSSGGGGNGGGGVVTTTTSSHTVTTTTPPVTKPAINTVGYDDHLCEMVYTGTGPIKNGWTPYTIDGITYCYVPKGAFAFDAYPMVRFAANGYKSSGLQPVFLRDFEDPYNKGSIQLKTLVIKFYSDGLWRRVSGPGAVEILYQPNPNLAGKWVTLADYNAAEKQRLQNESATRQQAAAAARQQTAVEVGKLYARIANAGSVFVQPACNWNPPCR